MHIEVPLARPLNASVRRLQLHRSHQRVKSERNRANDPSQYH